MKGNLARLVPAIERELREAGVRAERRQAAAELRRVSASARCILWYAEVRKKDGGGYDWHVKIADEEAARRLLNLDVRPDEQLLDAWFRSIMPADLDRMESASSGAIEQGLTGFSHEIRYRQGDGAVKWLLEHASIEANGAGGWLVVGVCTDVTERKQAEEALLKTNRRLEEAQVEILKCLGRAAEYRDDDTGQHTQRVGQMAARVAEAMGLPRAHVDLIRHAAPLHDLGKIGIPDSILLKPGRLTPEEFEQMKTHAPIVARILAGSPFALLELAMEIAFTHQERWDGSGYPRGLAGEQIPLAGRIVAVADVFDALTHERPYKHAWSVDEALTEIIRQSGRSLDPCVTRAFLSVCHQSTPLDPDA